MFSVGLTQATKRFQHGCARSKLRTSTHRYISKSRSRVPPISGPPHLYDPVRSPEDVGDAPLFLGRLTNVSKDKPHTDQSANLMEAQLLWPPLLPMKCERCQDTGWVCEEHPDKPLNHDGCQGAGEPCDCNDRGGARAARTRSDRPRNVALIRERDWLKRLPIYRKRKHI